MDKWMPINYRGSWHHDPRDELRHRAQVARDSHDSWVAIPVALAIAVAELRECSATTVITGDEDGPFSSPIEVKCRLPKDHQHMHTTGTLSWASEAPPAGNS